MGVMQMLHHMWYIVQVSRQLAGKCAEVTRCQAELHQVQHMLAAAYAANAALQVRLQQASRLSHTQNHSVQQTWPMHKYMSPACRQLAATLAVCMLRLFSSQAKHLSLVVVLLQGNLQMLESTLRQCSVGADVYGQRVPCQHNT